MMCISAVAAFFGLIAGLVGLDCVTVMEGSKGKVWVGRSGGFCMILAGSRRLNNYIVLSLWCFFYFVKHKLNRNFAFNSSLFFVL